MINSTTLKHALHVEVEMSTAMTTALQTWSSMYTNEAGWLDTYVKSLSLPAAIAGEISRSVTLEMEVEVSGSARADYLALQMERVIPKLRDMLEFANAKGGIMFKPYRMGDEIIVDYVQADQFYPISFDANGNITACAFSDQKKIGNFWYTRLEYHTLTGTTYYVKNAAFKGTTQTDLGQPVPLDSVDEWKDLAPEATILNIEKPLFAYFRYPLANNVDPTSPLGVSCYSRAVDLIEQADKQWSDLLWEFDSGKRALYTDVLAFDKDADDKPILPNKRLYRTLNQSGNIGSGDDLFEDWSPTLREENILRGLDAILKKVEFNCGLAYGTLSDPQNVDKTAEEIKSSKQRSASTVVDSQKALENTLEHLLYAMDVYATLFSLSSQGTYTTVYDFDDSIVTDYAYQFSHDQQTVGMAAMPKVKFLERNYGLSEQEAQAWIAEAAAEQPETDPFGETA